LVVCGCQSNHFPTQLVQCHLLLPFWGRASSGSSSGPYYLPCIPQLNNNLWLSLEVLLSNTLVASPSPSVCSTEAEALALFGHGKVRFCSLTFQTMWAGLSAESELQTCACVETGHDASQTSPLYSPVQTDSFVALSVSNSMRSAEASHDTQ
jgi:hypothetical protein